MATVLRVKRRLDEEPLDALLISCKRKKTEQEEAQVDSHASSSSPHTAVVKFAGTIQNQGENIAKHISNTLTSKERLKTNFKQRTQKISVQETTRLTTREKSKQNRWKVINCSRSIDTGNNQEPADNGMTIIDVEDCSIELPNDEAAEYVYDLYYTKNEEEIAFDTGVSIHEIECDIDWSDHRGGEQYIEHDDSDSNSESCLKNDYPDSDPFTDDDGDDDESINEGDIVRAVNRCRINSDYDLSSDDLDDGDDSDPEYALDQADINIGGRTYAKWKLQLRKEINGTHDDDKSDDSDCSNYSGPVITEVNTDDEDDDGE